MILLMKAILGVVILIARKNILKKNFLFQTMKTCLIMKVSLRIKFIKYKKNLIKQKEISMKQDYQQDL
jgi:hypothetical protein